MPSAATAPPGGFREQCWAFAGDGTVETIAWSGDARTLFVLHRPAAGGWQLSRIDTTGESSIETQPILDATGPLTADTEGRPHWVASPAEGPARIDLYVDGAVQTLRTLPHPRITRLFWADDGLGGIEWGGSNDAFRLVRLEGLDSEFELRPITEFDPALVDAVISRDGGSQLTAIRGGDQPSHVEFIRDGRTSRRETEQPVVGLDAWVGRDTVTYRGEVDGLVRGWRITGDQETVLMSTRIYANALSAIGHLAFARVTEGGPQHGICVVQL